MTSPPVRPVLLLLVLLGACTATPPDETGSVEEHASTESAGTVPGVEDGYPPPAGAGWRGEDGYPYRPSVRALGWSADGERLLFVHEEEYWQQDSGTITCGNSGLYETDLRSPPSPVVTGEEWCARSGDEGISLGADGRMLVSIHPMNRVGNDCTPIHRLDVERRRWLREHRVCDVHVSSPALSPDGRRLAAMLSCGYISGGEGSHRTPPGCRDPRVRLHLLDMDGGRRRPIGVVPEGEYDPVWAPDGRTVLLRVGGGEGDHFVTIDTATRARRRLGEMSTPAISPDGAWIAFVRFPQDPDDHRIALLVRRADGGGARELFVNDDTTKFFNGWGYGRNGFPTHPMWSRDGRSLVFTRFHERGETLWRVDVDGSGLRQVAPVIPPG